jgi:hypothetical protein
MPDLEPGSYLARPALAVRFRDVLEDFAQRAPTWQRSLWISCTMRDKWHTAGLIDGAVVVEKAGGEVCAYAVG